MGQIALFWISVKTLDKLINPRRVGGLGYSSLSVVCVSVCPCVCLSLSLAYLVIYRHHNLYVGKLVVRLKI